MVYKKYIILDDLQWISDQRKKKSRAQLASELADQLFEESEFTDKKKLAASLAGSLRFREHRYYVKEERSKFRQERAFHQNRKRNKV